jgi:hypothetical protein
MADKLTNDLIESTPAPATGAITRWDNDQFASYSFLGVTVASLFLLCSGLLAIAFA